MERNATNALAAGENRNRKEMEKFQGKAQCQKITTFCPLSTVL